MGQRFGRIKRVRWLYSYLWFSLSCRSISTVTWMKWEDHHIYVRENIKREEKHIPDENIVKRFITGINSEREWERPWSHCVYRRRSQKRLHSAETLKKIEAGTYRMCDVKYHDDQLSWLFLSMNFIIITGWSFQVEYIGNLHLLSFSNTRKIQNSEKFYYYRKSSMYCLFKREWSEFSDCHHVYIVIL